MPQLPQFNSGRNIEARPIAPMRDEAAFPFQLTQQIAGVMGEINQKLMQARDVMEYTEAKAKYEVATADIQARAAQDPDFKNSGVYLKELQEAKKNSLIGVKNKEMANRAALEFDYGGQIAAIKINAGFHQKQMEYNKNSLSTGVNTLMQKSMAASTPAERANTQMAIDELIQLNVTNGTITDFEAQALVYEAKKNVAMFDAQYNPDRFLSNVDSYDLDQVNRTKLTSIANSVKDKITAEEIKIKKDTQILNSIEYTKSLILPGSKALSTAEIFKGMADETIPANFGQAYIRALTTKITSDDVAQDKSGFTEYIQEVFDSKNPDAIISAITNTLNGGADGRVNQKELNVLLQAAVSANEEMNKGESGFVKFGKSILGIFGFGKEKAEVIKDYVEEVNNGKKPEEAKKAAVEKGNIRTNPNRSKFEIGQILNHNGMSFEVLRFDDNGNPVFKKL